MKRPTRRVVAVRLALVWCLAALVLLAPGEAAAKIVRYAVLIGNRHGAADEAELRYAEDDARKVHDVLLTLGSFPAENTTMLLDADASAVERALIAVNDRIRSENARTDESVLFVYYSGHADSDTLHLGTTKLELDRLRRLMRGSPADFRMVVLDACRSGALTRVKGGRHSSPFAVRIDESLVGLGLVFMTSSTANEDSQESDEIKGSFFTHYLVSALRGVGDANRDGVVSVEEAYAYAYEQTLRASSRTLHGTQHPTFELDMRGQGQLGLTRVNQTKGGRLGFPGGRAYLVFARSADGPVVAEVDTHSAHRELALDAGRYFIRGRADDHLLEGEVNLQVGDHQEVADRNLRRIEYARLARKGAGARHFTHGPQVGFQLRTPLWGGSRLCPGVRLGYLVELRWLSVAPRIGFCRAGYENERVTATADEYDLDLALTHVFDFPVVSVGIGLGGGVSLLRQTFTAAGLAPPRNTIGGHADAVLELIWDLPRGFYLSTQVAGSLYAFLSQRGADPRASMAAVFALRPAILVGKRF